MRKDLCPQGLLYFDVDLENNNSANAKNSRRQNRYGAATVKFHLNHATPSNWSFFRLGTKRYSKSYSQHLLATNIKNNGWSQWWLFDETRSQLFLLSQIKKIKQFLWNVRYCDENSCSAKNWTHPEIVVDGDIQISLCFVRIRFQQNHKCIQLLDGRRFNCIECDIRESGGVCLGQNNFGAWELKLLNCTNSEELSIEMFALSTPPQVRERIKELQSLLPFLFNEEQLGKIVQYWNTFPYVKRWITYPVLGLYSDLNLNRF
jgi:hypothetical protein